MTEEAALTKLDEASPSVQAHLSIVQGIINRMASNSASSKAWSVALVSAILVIVADKGIPDLAFVALGPVVLFGALDAYYLALEKGFRDGYAWFVTKVHNGSLLPSDLYEVRLEGAKWPRWRHALGSFSVWGFHGMLLLVVVMIRFTILPDSPAESAGA